MQAQNITSFPIKITSNILLRQSFNFKSTRSYVWQQIMWDLSTLVTFIDLGMLEGWWGKYEKLSPFRRRFDWLMKTGISFSLQWADAERRFLTGFAINETNFTWKDITIISRTAVGLFSTTWSLVRTSESGRAGKRRNSILLKAISKSVCFSDYRLGFQHGRC